MVLTKRPDQFKTVNSQILPAFRWVFETIWFGVTVTCQDDDWRIKHLLEVPAAGHFICYEPALGELDLSDVWGLYEYDDGEWATKVGSRWEQSPDWVILGGLSGSWLPPDWNNRISFNQEQTEWANRVIGQAKAADVPVFVKTKPVTLPEVEVIQEWPYGLRKEE